jgi:hypothetical protein
MNVIDSNNLSMMSSEPEVRVSETRFALFANAALRVGIML